MKEVRRFFNVTAAYALQFALQAEGIECVVRGETLSGIFGNPFSVWVVHDEDLEQARQITPPE
ncbi:MAG: DUF2007 domain-containing protein [Gemmatimonadales bacterium]